MTDWGATHDRIASLEAGCELDMPGDNPHNRARIIAAARDGRLDVAVLDEAVRRMLRLVERCTDAAKPSGPHDAIAHGELARDVAIDGAVLLTNDGTLPLSADAGGLLVVGELFERMRFQGAGSSLVTPTEVVTPRDAFDARGIRYSYARGYRAMYTERDPELASEAVNAAREAGTVLFFGGLTDLEESEGFDRTTMALAESQTALLRELLDTGVRVVLVLFAGAPVELPFADELAAVLDLHLPGMRGGDAAAALLFGEANPAGRLAESWPLTAADASSAADFDQGPVARYAESIYLGYRGYDAAGTTLRFPFGHGLSYTVFAYRDLRVEVRDGRVTARVELANTGERDGTEVVQLYVRNNRGRVFKAEKELRAFAKVRVAAGETASVELAFALDDLAYWDVADHGWRLENGDYEVLVAASASDIRLRAPLRVDTGRESRSPYPAEVDVAYASPPAGIPDAFPALVGRPVPERRTDGRLTMETRLADAQRSLLGRIMLRAVVARVERQYREALALPDGVERDARVKNGHFLVRMMPTQSLRSMAMSSSGALSYRVAAAMVLVSSGHPIRAIRALTDRTGAQLA
jgi:beta-glucosidase